jgi:hypothetical protein
LDKIAEESCEIVEYSAQTEKNSSQIAENSAHETGYSAAWENLVSVTQLPHTRSL